MADKEALAAELTEKYQGNVAIWDYEALGLVAVAKPAEPEKVYREFFDQKNDSKLKNSAVFENLATASIVHPEDAEVALRIADEHGGGEIYDWANAAAEFCGESIARGDEKNEPAEVAELRRQHKRLFWWDVPGIGIVVAAKPKGRQAFQELLDALGDPDESNFDAHKAFALACVIAPELSVVEQAFKNYPALAPKIADACSALCVGGGKRLGKA